MAVKEEEIKPIKLASQFWPTFFRQRLIVLITTQIFLMSAFTLILMLILSKTLTINSLILWPVTIALFAVSLGLNVMILLSTARPTRDLMAAIITVSGEKSALTPPNPNTSENERTGFRDALQTIYELSTKKSSEIEEAAEPQISVVAEALDITTCGFVAMNKNRKVIYANKAAPTHIDIDGLQTLDLLFNEKDSLDTWLNECSDNSVHAKHVWVRIPDRLPNQEGRRFFDVIASYQKSSTIEVILCLVDKTDSYITEEEDLDFISFAAHELRGPITVIKGYVDILQDELHDVLQNDQAELFNRLSISSSRLSGYIDNILNTSRYDRRHLKIRLNEDTVTAVYDIIKDDMQLRASVQNRLLSVNIPADLPTIAVDRASMSEVFGNLIDNAIKYSNEGGAINVTAKTNGNFVDVSIQDHGIGMPESVVSQLFQKFYRSHRSRETVAGTGIGLYISKAIVESHGGTVSVRSQDGRGSTFIVSLPIYSTVADKLKTGDNSNEGLISEGNGWIKNHSMFRG